MRAIMSINLIKKSFNFFFQWWKFNKLHSFFLHIKPVKIKLHFCMCYREIILYNTFETKLIVKFCLVLLPICFFIYISLYYHNFRTTPGENYFTFKYSVASIPSFTKQVQFLLKQLMKFKIFINDLLIKLKKAFHS